MREFINKVRFTVFNNKVLTLLLLGFWIFVMFFGNPPARVSYTLLFLAILQEKYIQTRYALILSTMMLNLEEETKMAIKLSDERIIRKGE